MARTPAPAPGTPPRYGTSSGGPGYGSSSGQGYGDGEHRGYGYGSSSGQGYGDGGKGHKGYGTGNYGTEIPVPCPIGERQAVKAAHIIPKARSATEHEIQQWMVDNFEVLPDFQGLRGGGDTPYELGDVVLWKGFKNNNKNSLAIEYFRGVINEIDMTPIGTFLTAN
jgi:hypothetical protein